MFIVSGDNHVVALDIATGAEHWSSPDAGKFTTAWGGFGRANGQFLGPVSVAVDGNGNVYVSDETRDDVQVFTADGMYIRTIGEHGSEPRQLDFALEV